MGMMGLFFANNTTIRKGFPDYVFGTGKKNFLFEIKDGNKYASQQKLTVAEQDFCDSWKGQYHVITCLDDAIKIINSTD